MYLNKINLFFTLLILGVTINCAYSGVNVPVFIWGSSSVLSSTSPQISPLTHLAEEEFANELDNVVKKGIRVVLFVDEKLSPEDFHCTEEGVPCFKNLKSAYSKDTFLYYPSVENPTKVLQSKADVEVVNFDNSHQYFETRQQLLTQHDAFIQEKLDSLQKSNEEFVAIYTGKVPSLNVQPNIRVARAADAKEEDSITPQNISGKVFLYYLNLKMITKDNEKGVNLNMKNFELTDHSDPNTNTAKLYEVILSDESNTSLKLNFTGRSGYWSISSVSFQYQSGTDRKLRPSVDIAGMTGFSFHCDPVTRFTSGTHDENDYLAVTLTDLQVQPFFGPLPTEFKFGDSLDCVGFMSAPILAGLFVTFMLASIVALGICMMMDLKTMDRFEDPKGKTITVTATD